MLAGALRVLRQEPPPDGGVHDTAGGKQEAGLRAVRCTAPAPFQHTFVFPVACSPSVSYSCRPVLVYLPTHTHSPPPLPRRQEDVWRASALAKLPALQAASDMLVCGEDLGFVPACVPPVMKVRRGTHTGRAWTHQGCLFSHCASVRPIYLPSCSFRGWASWA